LQQQFYISLDPKFWAVNKGTFVFIAFRSIYKKREGIAVIIDAANPFVSVRLRKYVKKFKFSKD